MKGFYLFEPVIQTTNEYGNAIEDSLGSSKWKPLPIGWQGLTVSTYKGGLTSNQIEQDGGGEAKHFIEASEE